jgi:hypothetical protein
VVSCELDPIRCGPSQFTAQPAAVYLADSGDGQALQAPMGTGQLRERSVATVSGCRWVLPAQVSEKRFFGLIDAARIVGNLHNMLKAIP